MAIAFVGFQHARLMVRGQEQEQLAAIRDQVRQEEETKRAATESNKSQVSEMDRDFEGGFGGQEDLEDRYATTLGEH